MHLLDRAGLFAGGYDAVVGEFFCWSSVPATKSNGRYLPDSAQFQGLENIWRLTRCRDGEKYVAFLKLASNCLEKTCS
jgi:hypothetical protein